MLSSIILNLFMVLCIFTVFFYVKVNNMIKTINDLNITFFGVMR